MLSKKNYIVIGLTTFHSELLRISVPGVARLDQKIYLIIHNDNPDANVTERQIRKLGYCGPLHIINTKKNLGPLKSRLNILSAITDLRIKSEWMVFVDDDDMIVNVDIPDISANTFAIMQNMAVIKKRLIDLLKIMDDYKNCIADDDHIVVERPHIGIAGTLIRTNLITDLGRWITPLLDKIYQIDESLGYRAPDDMMMWNCLVMYAKHINPAAAPIYMDQINYIATSLDSVSHKYGQHLLPPNNHEQYFESALRRYNAVFESELMPKDD